MPTSAQNAQVARAALGFTVIRPTGLVAQALTSMFTITGGQIIVNSLHARLTIASDASNATTITLGFTSSEGGAVSNAAGIASSSIVGVVREIGTRWTAPAIVGGAMLIGTNASTIGLPCAKFILGPGSITYTGGVGVNPASAIWYLNYVPLDAGVNVVAV